MKIIDLSGCWSVELSDGRKAEAMLPGTLDENRIGDPDRPAKKLFTDENYQEIDALTGGDVIGTRFTRKYTYEGTAVFSRVFGGELREGKRLFLEAERTRILRLLVDGTEIPALCGSLSTPYRFEVTGKLKKGSRIDLICDNSYGGSLRSDILYSSAATDETQTNWNGILGYIRLREEEQTWLSQVKIYTSESVTVKALVDSTEEFFGRLRITSDALAGPEEKTIRVAKGTTEVVLTDLPMKKAEDLRIWDEYRGELYEAKVELLTNDDKNVISEKTVSFGIRTFGTDGKGHLALNGRRIFLRSEANCAVFPETGHMPLDRDSWKKILETYMGYGINCLRFHSHCPPDAAFTAADDLGILMQPELSHWNPEKAFGTSEARKYYSRELREILEEYANHPSFVMLTFGNELQADEEDMVFIHGLLDGIRKADPTRLYAASSNMFYGAKGCDPASDFYTSSNYGDLHLRATFAGMVGYLNEEYPSAKHSYDSAMEKLRKQYAGPVFSFEVGQYEVLPDFAEIDSFGGVTRPDNYKLIHRKAEKEGLLELWPQMVEATGELSLLCYREEVEAALRTKEYSGISLLGLQDFPGQGTALVGMLNSHLDSKPYSFADPTRFRAFFRPVLPLVLLEKYTYTAGEEILAKVLLANYSSQVICGKLGGSLTSASGDEITVQTSGEEISVPAGSLTEIGEIRMETGFVKEHSRFDLRVRFGEEENTYPVWVYAGKQMAFKKPEAIYECKAPDESALEILRKGGMVLLAPDPVKEQMPNSIRSTFSADFWSVGTFSSQEGSMGLLIDAEHPLFRRFPTEFHTNYQWWKMASGRAQILPPGMRSIVTVPDSYAYMRNLSLLAEFRVGPGKLFLCTAGLAEGAKYPECRALLAEIYSYMASDAFRPSQELSEEVLRNLFQSPSTD